MTRTKTPKLNTLLKPQLQGICVKEQIEYIKKDTKKVLVAKLIKQFGGDTLPPDYEMPAQAITGLSFLMLRFVDEFIALGMVNATQAAENAGYGGDRRTLQTRAHKLTQHPKIRELIRSRWAEATMQAEEAMVLMGQIARGNMAHVIRLDEDGNIQIKKDALDEYGHLIKSIKANKTKLVTDKVDKESEYIGVILHDKIAALRIIMQAQEKLPGDGTTVNVNVGKDVGPYTDRELLTMSISILENNQANDDVDPPGTG